MTVSGSFASGNRTLLPSFSSIHKQWIDESKNGNRKSKMNLCPIPRLVLAYQDRCIDATGHSNCDGD